MPLLDSRQKETVYQDWLSAQTKKGRWIRVVRIPGSLNRRDESANPTHTFVSFNEDARWLHHWLGFSLLPEDDHTKVQFGSVRIFDVWAAATAAKFRVLILDCSL